MATTGKWLGRGVVAAVLGGLAVTANGYRPLVRRGPLSVYAFAAGVFATELPLRLIAVQAALLAAVSRRLSPAQRWAGWLAAALSWLGLAGLERRGRSAGTVLAAALAPTSDPAPVAPAVLRRRGLSMLLAHRDYVTDAGVSYGEHGFRNTVDIWRRPELVAGGGAPVLVQIHGGAWMVGQKGVSVRIVSPGTNGVSGVAGGLWL